MSENNSYSHFVYNSLCVISRVHPAGLASISRDVGGVPPENLKN